MHRDLIILKGLASGLKTGEVTWHLKKSETTILEDLQKVFSSIKDLGNFYCSIKNC